mgnify:CR=1 FL=1
MKAQAVLFLCISLALASSPMKGVDVSQRTDVFSCIHGKGYKFAIVRGFQSSGYVDPNVVTNIDNAISAGMSFADVYLFPCVPCANPKTQAQKLVDSIKGKNYKRIWVDIEKYHWHSDKSQNQQFITDIVNELKDLGQSVGIYTSYYNWESITGLDWKGVSDLPLWYPHYDNDPSFSDFKSFGGWTKPTMKQYGGNKELCNAGVDLDWES